MITIFFLQTRDTIQDAVKRETSLLAERRKDPQGVIMDELIMDEEYEITLKAYMNEAKAEIMLNIPSNMISNTQTDIESIFREFPAYDQDRDFSLIINLHDDFPQQYQKSIDTFMQSYMTDYICYRWLETKSPNDAATYYTRLAKTMSDIKRLLTRKSIPVKRYPSFP